MSSPMSGENGKTIDIEPSRKRNAFSELMSPKSKRPKTEDLARVSQQSAAKTDRRNGLLEYIAHPKTFPNSVVIYHNSEFVLINDLYPKSMVHLLLLPRDPRKYNLHPFKAFEDAAFLELCRTEIKNVRALAASELRRLLGQHSALDQARTSYLESDTVEGEVPRGRDWQAELMIGVHAVPSMSHLHIHIISKDRYSECLKHRKHYNSFSTPFFVPLDDFPLSTDDPRRHSGREGYLKKDFICWRCGQNFGSRFVKLKDHLKQEFEEWRKD